LIQAAKLESIGTLAAGIAHEVKNPLQTLLTGLDYLSNHAPANNQATTCVLSEMRDSVQRANSIIHELLQLSAPTKFHTSPQDLNAIVESALRLIHNQLAASHITVVRNLAADLPSVQIDSGKIGQVFLNLFINALQAMAQAGMLSVATRAVQIGEDLALQDRIFRQFKPSETVVVTEVQDTGTGISEAHLPKIFDPFFTTKQIGVGTGLGLSVVKKIVHLHGGVIAIRNTPPRGVLVTLVLKAHTDEHRN